MSIDFHKQLDTGINENTNSRGACLLNSFVAVFEDATLRAQGLFRHF